MLLIRVSIVLSLVRIKSPRTEWVFTVITVAAEVSPQSFSRQKRSSIIFYIFSLERIFPQFFKDSVFCLWLESDLKNSTPA